MIAASTLCFVQFQRDPTCSACQQEQPDYMMLLDPLASLAIHLVPCKGLVEPAVIRIC